MKHATGALDPWNYLDLGGMPLIRPPSKEVHPQQHAVVHHPQSFQQGTVLLNLLHQPIICAGIQDQLEVNVKILRNIDKAVDTYASRLEALGCASMQGAMLYMSSTVLPACWHIMCGLSMLAHHAPSEHVSTSCTVHASWITVPYKDEAGSLEPGADCHAAFCAAHVQADSSAWITYMSLEMTTQRLCPLDCACVQRAG